MAEVDHIRNLHEFALEARTRLLMRTGKAKTPQDMWALATGSAASWALHRVLERLTEVDPAGVQAFIAELAEELEMPELADEAGEVAERMGFTPQRWIDDEYARRSA